MADEEIYRYSEEGRGVVYADISQMETDLEAPVRLEAEGAPAETAAESMRTDEALLQTQRTALEAAEGGVPSKGSHLEVGEVQPGEVIPRVQLHLAGAVEELKNRESEIKEAENQDVRDHYYNDNDVRPDCKTAEDGKSQHHPTVLDPFQPLQLSHCQDPNCKCGNKVHCPFCNIKHYKPSRPARVRDHLTLLHFLHAVHFQDKLVVKCFHNCMHPAGHYHCPVCSNQIIKRVAFAHHLRSHLTKQGKNAKAVRTPNHKQVDRILFGGEVILLCRERCANTLGRHYHCPFCTKVSFSKLGPMMSHMWRCRESCREGSRARLSQEWSLLTEPLPDVPHPRRSFPDKWHRSIVRNLQDVEIVRCDQENCCGQKFHCTLCTADKFKPTFLQHLKAHYLAHWRSRLQYNEYSILVCYNSCEVQKDAGTKICFHFHCPKCGITRRRKRSMLNHLQVCGHQSDVDTLVKAGTVENISDEGSNDDDDIGWPDDDDDGAKEVTVQSTRESTRDTADISMTTLENPASSLANNAHADGVPAGKTSTTSSTLLTAEEVIKIVVFLPVAAVLTTSVVQAILSTSTSVAEFCENICQDAEVTLTHSPGITDPVYALTGSLAALTTAQDMLHKKLFTAMTGQSPEETTPSQTSPPRRRGRPPKLKPVVPNQGTGLPIVKRKVGRPRRPQRGDPDFTPLKSAETTAQVALGTTSQRYSTRGIKLDYSAMESGRLRANSLSEKKFHDEGLDSQRKTKIYGTTRSNKSAPLRECLKDGMSVSSSPPKRDHPSKTVLVASITGESTAHVDNMETSSSSTQTPVVSPARCRGRPRKVPKTSDSFSSSLNTNCGREAISDIAPDYEGTDDSFDVDTGSQGKFSSNESVLDSEVEETSEMDTNADEITQASQMSPTAFDSDMSTAIFPTVAFSPSNMPCLYVPQPRPTSSCENIQIVSSEGDKSVVTTLYRCPRCSMMSQTFMEISEHLTTEHPEMETLCCHVCERILSSPADLERHLSARHGPKTASSRFTCTICAKACQSLAALRWHQTYNHGRTLVCQICQHESVTPLEHQAHKRQHRSQPPQCPICQKMLGNLANLRVHMQAQHINMRHHCPVKDCGKVFRHARYLGAHVRRHRAGKTHICPTCGRSFACANTLNEHMETHKAVSERRYRYICPYCAAQYRNKSNFQDHLNKHTGERPHKCPLCDKSFGFRSQLIKHKVFIHNSERPFQCPHCPRAFKFQRLLNQHSVVHSQVSPHTCQHCLKPYSCAATLKAHYRRCRGDQTVPASVPVATPVEKTVIIEMQNDGENMVNISALDAPMLSEASPGPEGLANQAPQVYVCGVCNQVFEDLNTAGEHITTTHPTDSNEIELKLETADTLTTAVFQAVDPLQSSQDVSLEMSSHDAPLEVSSHNAPLLPSFLPKMPL